MASSPESDTGFSTGSSSTTTSPSGDGHDDTAAAADDDAEEEQADEGGLAAGDDDDIQSVGSDVAVNGRLTAIENRSRDHSVICGTFESFNTSASSTKSEAGATTATTEAAASTPVDAGISTTMGSEHEIKVEVDDDEEEESKRPADIDETDTSTDSPTQQLPQYEENEIIFEEQLSPYSTDSGVFGSSVWNVQALPDEYIDTFSSDEESKGSRRRVHVDGGPGGQPRPTVWHMFLRRKGRRRREPPKDIKKRVVNDVVVSSPDRTIPETPVAAASEDELSPLRSRRSRRRRRNSSKRRITVPWRQDRRPSSSSSRNSPSLPFHRRLDDAAADDDRFTASVGSATISAAAALAPSPLLFCLLLCCCLVVFLVATVGTAYAGTLLALNNFDQALAPPTDGTNSSTSSAQAPPTTAPTLQQPCDPNAEVFLQLEIRFDARPAEIGILLADDVPFGAALWEFNRGSSFRSFSQFVRRNTFGICLPTASAAFRLTITDRGGDGLRASFPSASGGPPTTTVYGSFVISMNGKRVASYSGNCDDGTVDDCGAFCACEYRIDDGAVVGGCTSDCAG